MRWWIELAMLLTLSVTFALVVLWAYRNKYVRRVRVPVLRQTFRFCAPPGKRTGTMTMLLADEHHKQPHYVTARSGFYEVTIRRIDDPRNPK